MSEIALRTVHLTERYGRLEAVDDLGPEESPGEVFGFLGLNAAGKSTALRMVLGLAHPSAGHAEVFGADARDVAVAHRRKVALIAAFATRVSLLVLDEPLSGLDPLMEKQFRNVVRAPRARAKRVTVLSADRPSRSETLSR